MILSVAIERIEGVPRAMLTHDGKVVSTTPALRVDLARRACSLVAQHDGPLGPPCFGGTTLQVRLDDTTFEISTHGVRLVERDPWDRCPDGYGLHPPAARAWLESPPAQELLAAVCEHHETLIYGGQAASRLLVEGQRALALLLRGLRRLPPAYQEVVTRDYLAAWQPNAAEQTRLQAAETDLDLEEMEADLTAAVRSNGTLVLEDLVPTLRRWQERLNEQ